MELKQGNLLQSLKEVQKFLDENAAKLAGINQTGARKRLDDLVTELGQKAGVQSGAEMAAKAATRRQRALSKVLIDHHMAPIAHIAGAELPPTPELAPLAMPKTRQNGERLIGQARGMAAEAAKYESTFVQAGLAPDFIQQLLAAADALAAAIGDHKLRKGDRGGATEALAKQLSAGRKVVKVLNDFVQKTGQDDIALLGAWRIVKRLRQASAVKEVAASEAAPAAATTGGAA